MTGVVGPFAPPPIPPGGDKGQVLTKVSNASGDANWQSSSGVTNTVGPTQYPNLTGTPVYPLGTGTFNHQTSTTLSCTVVEYVAASSMPVSNIGVVAAGTYSGLSNAVAVAFYDSNGDLLTSGGSLQMPALTVGVQYTMPVTPIDLVAGDTYWIAAGLSLTSSGNNGNLFNIVAPAVGMPVARGAVITIPSNSLVFPSTISVPVTANTTAFPFLLLS